MVNRVAVSFTSIYHLNDVKSNKLDLALNGWYNNFIIYEAKIMLKRLQELSNLLNDAQVSAVMARHGSLNNSGPLHARKHQQKIDEFNQKKFWFFRKRKYEV